MATSEMPGRAPARRGRRDRPRRATSTAAPRRRSRPPGSRPSPSRADAVVLNFEGAGYINSTGIALIVGLLARARAAGIEVRAYGLTPHYREIFEITRLADFLAINPDEDSAVRGAEGSRDA